MGLCKTCLQALEHNFKDLLASKGVNVTDLLNQGWQQDFEYFTRYEPSAYKRELLENLDTLETVIHRVVNTYGVLRMKENELNALKENGIQAMADSLIAREKVDADLVVMESNGIESGMHDTSSSSGNYITHVVDANIRPVNDQVPFAEVQLTAQHNVLANEQQHTDQSKPIYDTYLLEKVNRNTSTGSTNMSHRGGEINQDAEHDKDSPEFHEFFEINELKAQLQAKTTLICNLKNQIKSVKEASNEAKVKNDIDVIETINIELEHSVAKLLAANEQLHKENEYLKHTYKELYDLIKKTRVQNKDNSDSLISQINQKSVKNADLKAQIQEKVFVNAALKNKLRKLKGNSVDTKFAKTSILGKPPL
ncbi:hypothetical protein Tco_0787236 [Tanacetum coccineum]